MTDFEECAHYHSDLDFEPKKNSIIIIDEIDYFIYGDTGHFYSFQLKQRIIGFTATASSKEIQGLERSVFETMKFNEATYWPSSEPKPFIDYYLSYIPGICFGDICTWVSVELSRAAVLLYCEAEESLRCWTNDMAPYLELKNRRDFKNLTNLDKADD